MYLLDIPPYKYQDPWNTSLEYRIKLLFRRKRKVAYFYENPDNSTFRYRVYNMVQVINQLSPEISASYFTLGEIQALIKIVDMVDVLVICRSKYTDHMNRLITKAKNHGVEVIFDVDDLVFNPAYVQLVLDTLDQDFNNPNLWDFWYAYMGRIGGVLQLCDRAITTNSYLAARISDYAHVNVSIIPNFINMEQLEYSRQIFAAKQNSGFARDGRIHIGYFSGTPSHNKDLCVAADALVEIMKQYPNVNLRVVGYVNLNGAFHNFKSRVEWFPLQDFVNLQKLIGEVEVNIVPLQENTFTNCKSELKYFEAGIVGTTSLTSPTSTYKKAIQQGINGFVSNSYEWYDRLSYIVNNIDSLQSISEKAFADSETKHSWNSQFENIIEALFP